MSVLRSKLSPGSDEFQANAEANGALVDDLAGAARARGARRR